MSDFAKTIVVADDDWNLPDQLTQMKSLINISERQAKAFYGESQQQIKQNEKILNELKQEINTNRIALSRMIPEDDRLLRVAFKRYPHELKHVQHKDTEFARQLLEERLMHLRKELMSLKNKKMVQDKQMEDITFKLHDLEKLQEKTGVEDSKIRIRHIDNQLNTTKTKMDTANIIHHRYEEILNKLRKDENVYPDLLERMERTAQKLGQELSKMKHLCLQGQEVRDVLRVKLATLEFELFQIKQEREMHIGFLRKEVEKRNEPELKKTKQEDSTDPRPGAQKRMAELNLLQKFQRENDLLLEAAKISDIRFFLTSWKRLSRASHHLLSQVESQEEKRVWLNKEGLQLDELKTAVDFTGGDKDQKTSMEIEMENSISEEKEKLRVISKNRKEMGDVVQKVRAGIKSLSDIINIVELPEELQPTITGDELLDQVLLCDSCLAYLVETIKEQGTEEEILEQMATSPTKVEETVDPNKIRIPLVEKVIKGAQAFPPHEEADVPYGLNREAIKSMGQALIDSHTKKKKKKKSKQRK